mgnify:CR=1 FL=1
MMPMIMAIKNSEILGQSFKNLCMGTKILKIKPKKTGKKTIKNENFINEITYISIF